MSRDNSQLFGRGETFYGPTDTIDQNALKGANLLGQEKAFEDLDYGASGSVKTARTNQMVYVRAVRNTSGVNLLPKEFVQVSADGTQATGRVVNSAQHGYPVDEFLPAAGVRNGDVFYVVVEGPATMKTAFTGAEFGGSDVAAGDSLHSVTTTAGSTQTGSTTEGGRVAKFATVAATTVAQFNALLDFAKNWVGTALSARTTGNMNVDVLVDVRRRY